MSTFCDIPDLGPGTTLYSLAAADYTETLFRTTTGDYVVERRFGDAPGERSYSILDEYEATAWCLEKGKCRSEDEFRKRVFKVVCNTSEGKPIGYRQRRFLLPSVGSSFERVLEFLQLPVF